MMKLNREQIIQALEFCGICECNNEKTNTECALINMSFCKNYLRNQALALIKELTEENVTYETNELNYIRQISRLQAKVEGVKAKTANEILERARKYTHAFSDGTNIEEYVHIEDVERAVEEVLEENK